MEQRMAFSKPIIAFFLSLIAVSGAIRQYGVCPQVCDFQCTTGVCIKRSQYCDGVNNCADGSDERHCQSNYNSRCPTSPVKYLGCYNSRKCIPAEWKCDGYLDCPYKDDENNCNNSTLSGYTMKAKRQKAVKWLQEKSIPDSATRKWGPFVNKFAIAFSLSNPSFLSNSSARQDITYELHIQMLSRINKQKIQGIPSSDLASFINAFLVTCTDPKDFYGLNLVEELRSRVDRQNYTSPYLLLTLCNAGDEVTETDVKKLIDAFWSNNREIWTDVQAMALMALSCARNQMDSTVDDETMNELAMELKQHQYRNGTVENLLTTLLVMQALYSAEPDEDPNNFDERKAMSYILENQKPDGSFGNLLLTYYALPVLNCRSLVNISSSHCKPVEKDVDAATFDLVNLRGPKIRVHFSVWIGAERDIERSLSLLVPANISFYAVMEFAAEIDSRYKFDSVVKNRKPYITSVFGILNDPESEHFWFPCIMKDGEPSIIQKSTTEIIAKHKDHLIMWYRKGNWAD